MSQIIDYEFCKETLQLKDIIEDTFISLGGRLRKIKNEELYKGQWTDFREFCQEMKISEATASKLINIFEKFVIMYEIPVQKILSAGGWATVAECLPMIKSKEDAEEWLDKASVLTREDLRTEIRIAKNKVLPEECQHNYITIEFCTKCKERHQIYEE